MSVRLPLLICTAAVVLFVATSTPAVSDFMAFHASGVSLQAGQTPYFGIYRPNMNLPYTVLAMAPLGALPLGWAFWLWTLIGVAAIAASLRALHRAHGRPVCGWPWIVVLLLVSAPAWTGWHLGQVAWVLLYPMTRAYVARSPVTAGLWLVPVIVVKPFALVAALLLPWRIAVTASAASAVVSLALLLSTSPAWWADWIVQSQIGHWFNQPINASLWGMAFRLQTGARYAVPLSDLWWGWYPPILAGLAWMAWHTTRATGAARWASAWLVAVLASPMGWIYYLPIGVAPLLVAWRWTPTTRSALALLLIPEALLLWLDGWPLAFQILSHGYTVGVVLVVLAFTRDSAASPPAAAPPTPPTAPD